MNSIARGVATKLFSRRLEAPQFAASRIFNRMDKADNARTGRKKLLRQLAGPTLNDWYIPHMNTFGVEYHSEAEVYWKAKNAYLRWKGKPPTKKGQGKKNQKAKAAAAKNKSAE